MRCLSIHCNLYAAHLISNKKMLSRKRTTMAALEPNAKHEYDIDPSPKESKHFDENGNVNNFAQEFSKESGRKRQPPKKKSQTPVAFNWVPKNSDAKIKDQLIEMEVDIEHIDRSQTYPHITSFKKELTASPQGQINYYVQFQQNDKQKHYDLKMDESSSSSN